MTIDSNTRIASLIKYNKDALEAIITLSPKFSRLRNPVLRKLLAARTSIAMASKIGGCSIEDFFMKLKPLGFEIDPGMKATTEATTHTPMPDFMKGLSKHNMVELDVRPVINAGKDPLNLILQKIKSLEPGHVLNIINHFEPTPLRLLLGKQGYESFSEIISDEEVNTYFYKTTETPDKPAVDEKDFTAGWDDLLIRFNNQLQTIDVRNLEMPLPMHSILQALDHLPVNEALYVYHKRIPVFLLPELEEQQFSYRIKEISDTEVHMLIYKK